MGLYLLLILIPIAVIGFSLYGFVCFLGLLAERESRGAAPDYEPDVQATRRVLDRLYAKGEISRQEYLRLVRALLLHFPAIQLPPPIVGPTQTMSASDRVSAGPTLNVPGATFETPKHHAPISLVPEEPASTPPTEDAQGAAQTAIRQAEPTHAMERPTGPASASTRSPSFDDLVDSPPKPPERTWSELLSEFMQERNIRWGELASGILIVGSAVGLVVSLREELQDTIPYFPALLFMLITAAINGAGVYTLRRWRLQNTSRGILVIGLLLVPLNFLAACVLSGDGSTLRPLTDPIYWIAIAVGIASFSAMTWIGGRCLLRCGYLPLVVGVMVSSVSVLITNRAAPNLPGPLGTSLLGLVPLTGVLGSHGFWWQQRRPGHYWSNRVANRAWLILGLSMFAFACAVAMLVLRSENAGRALVATLPAIAGAAATFTWVGWIVFQGTSVESQFVSQRLVSLSITLLGAAVIVASLVASVWNPSILVATGLIASIGLFAASIQSRSGVLLPLAWAAAAISVVALIHLVSGPIVWNAWINSRTLWDTTTSAASGLGFGAIGLLVMAASPIVSSWQKDNERWFGPEVRQINQLTGASLLSLGCAVALVASFLHPTKTFDVMVASSLLGVVAFGCCLQTVMHAAIPRSAEAAGLKRKAINRLALATVMSLVVFGWHAFLWNRMVASFVVRWFAVDCRWVLLALLVMVITSITAGARAYRLARGGRAEAEDDTVTDLSGAVVVSGLITLIGAAVFVSTQNSLSVQFAALTVASVGGLASYYPRADVIASFRIITALALSMVVAHRYAQRSPDDAHIWLHAAHAWWQVTAFSLWNIGWQVYDHIVLRTTHVDERETPRTIHEQCLAVVDGARRLLVMSLLGLFVVSSAPHVMAELDGSISLPESLDFHRVQWLMLTGAVAVTFCLVVSLLLDAKWIDSCGLVLVALFSVAIPATYFESKVAVASALRWLIPMASAVVAVAIGSRGIWSTRWKMFRNRLCRTSTTVPSWSHERQQAMINIGLVFAVVSTLAITTAAISQVMLNGAGALGGPTWPSFFAGLRRDVSYGGPVAILVATLLGYAISERRSWLAVAGSIVCQYVVVVSIVLLFLSPHPKLASAWFLNIMQAVSLGMSGYGLLWHYSRERIGSALMSNKLGWSQLEVHTAINGSLVISLAVLIGQRFYFFPARSGAWINEAGGWLGVASLVMVTLLGITVWRHQLQRYLYVFVSLVGLAVAAFAASVVDRYVPPFSWWPYRTIAIGSTLVTVAQLSIIVLNRTARMPLRHDDRTIYVPLLISSIVAVLFAWSGVDSDPGFKFGYVVIWAIAWASAAVYGWTFQSGTAAWIAAVTAMATNYAWFVWRGRTIGAGPEIVHCAWVVLVGTASTWLAFYRRNRQTQWQRSTRYTTGRMIPRSFLHFTNTVTVVTPVWLLFSATINSPTQSFLHSWGGGLLLACSVLLVAWNLFSDRAYGRVWSVYVMASALLMLVINTFDLRGSNRIALNVMVPILAGLALSYAYRRLRHTRKASQRRSVSFPRRATLAREVEQTLSKLQVFAAIVASWFACQILWTGDSRLARVISAACPALAGVSLVPLTVNRRTRRKWPAQSRRYASLVLITVGAVFLSWGDLTLEEMHSGRLLILSRATMILCFVVGAYGWIWPRLIRDLHRNSDAVQSNWRSVLQRAQSITGAVTVVCFAWLLAEQWLCFRPVQGSGLPLPFAIMMCVVGGAMISGLVAIAVSPNHDPLALSSGHRQAYVYAAEAVAGMVGVHAYLSMPWLFQFGILKYWPYLAMLLSFGGVGVARYLRRRGLTVLEQPIFNTGAIIPVITAVGYWALRSETDAALVMLAGGLVYLVISLSHQSFAFAMLAVIFGNAALWLFYDKFPAMAFASHPQLWLIPPAFSVTVASHFQRGRLTPGQLSAIRYVSAAVIYVSSTSEIFIEGMGQSLWPPMILALLAVGGILTGMLFQIRPFLYLGATFLLMAMTSMVAHAQQRLNHVWPWWAFGLTLGTAILVLFGYIEKRRRSD